MVKAQFTIENTTIFSQGLVSLHDTRKKKFYLCVSTSNREILSQELACVLFLLKEMKALYSYIKEGFAFLYGWYILLLKVSEDRETIMQSRNWHHYISKAVLVRIQKIKKICICLLQLFIQAGIEQGVELTSFKKSHFCYFWERLRESKVTQMCVSRVCEYHGIRKKTVD